MSFILNFWWVFIVLFLVSFALMTSRAQTAARNPSQDNIRGYAIFMLCTVVNGFFLALGLMGQMVAHVLSVSHGH